MTEIVTALQRETVRRQHGEDINLSTTSLDICVAHLITSVDGKRLSLTHLDAQTDVATTIARESEWAGENAIHFSVHRDNPTDQVRIAATDVIMDKVRKAVGADVGVQKIQGTAVYVKPNGMVVPSDNNGISELVDIKSPEGLEAAKAMLVRGINHPINLKRGGESPVIYDQGYTAVGRENIRAGEAMVREMVPFLDRPQELVDKLLRAYEGTGFKQSAMQATIQGLMTYKQLFDTGQSPDR